MQLSLQDYQCIFSPGMAFAGKFEQELFLSLRQPLKVMGVLMLQERCPSSLAVSMSSRWKIPHL